MALFRRGGEKSGTGGRVKLPQVDGRGSWEGCPSSSSQRWDGIGGVWWEGGVCKGSASGVRMQQICRWYTGKSFALIDEP